MNDCIVNNILIFSAAFFIIIVTLTITIKYSGMFVRVLSKKSSNQKISCIGSDENKKCSLIPE